MNLRFNSRIFSFFLFKHALALTLSFAYPDSKNVAIQWIKSQAQCPNCNYFAISLDREPFLKDPIYLVSTTDRLPPPLWAVAVLSKRDPLILKNRNSWNEFIQIQDVQLKTEDQAQRLLGLLLQTLYPTKTLISTKVEKQNHEWKCRVEVQDVRTGPGTLELQFNNNGQILNDI